MYRSWISGAASGAGYQVNINEIGGLYSGVLYGMNEALLNINIIKFSYNIIQ